MKCRAFLASITKKAFSDKLELLFTGFPGGEECNMSFPSGQFSVNVSSPDLFNTLIPGSMYEIELRIVVDSKNA